MKPVGAWVLLGVGAAIGATDPAAHGPFPAAWLGVGIPGTQGATLQTDLYFPGTTADGVAPAAVPCPVVVLGHGFAQSKARHANQGLHLASRGYIVLIPEFNGGSDHARNGQDLVRCVDWVVERQADGASFLHGAVWTAAIGAAGHSAGGLSAILAAAADPRIRALSLMDPVDNGGQGVAALPSLSVPVAMTWSEPSSCNANGSAPTLYAAAAGIRRGMKVVGANHSDPQDPAGFLGILVCGAPNAGRQALYRRYMAGWFERHLRGDESYDPYAYLLPGGRLAADLAEGRVTYDAVAPLSLALAVEGGAPALHVGGPSGQSFDVQYSTNGAAWNDANWTGAAPALVTNLPPAGRLLWLRTRSLPE